MGDDQVSGVSGWFRSENMEYISIVLQEHCAHRMLSRLGRLGVVQFTDLNAEQTMFQRRYIREVQRCDLIERKLTYLDNQLKEHNVVARAQPELSLFLDRVEGRHLNGEVSRDQGNVMDKMEPHVEEKEKELVQLNRYNATLKAEFYARKELQHVLEKAKLYTSANDTDATFNAQSVPVGSGDAEAPGVSYEDSIRFRFITGVVKQEDRARFERMVFRSTRGNCLMRFYDIEEDMIDGATGESVRKDVFIIFFQAPYVEMKIKKICEAFNARLHQIPDLSNVAAIDRRASDVHNDIMDRQQVLQRNDSDIVALLSEVAQFIEVWKWIVLREKAIYHTMNHFASDVSGVLRAEGWVLSDKKDEVQQLVMQAHSEVMGGASTQVPVTFTTIPMQQWPSTPPTYFRVNKFTTVFQVIVDTYGVPRYHEANPALLTVITFPFCFGVMFGDIGHGTLLFLFALYIVYKENTIAKMAGSNELVDMLYYGRYMLVLMGFFAIYCGLIYNDFFAIGLLLFPPTTWDLNETASNEKTLYFYPSGEVYPLGVDPTWHRAENTLLFFNSLKMKMAVCFGVTQMSMGLIHRAQNALYFHKGSLFTNMDFWFEAIPMIVFMWSLFGYMCFLIVFKWLKPWQDCFRCPQTCAPTAVDCVPGAMPPDLSQEFCDYCVPPTLITMLINIALSPGGDIEYPLYPNQSNIQLILLIIAVLMIPIMLIPKPYFLIQKMKKEHHGHGNGRRAADVLHYEGGSGVAGNGSSDSAGSATELMLHDQGPPSPDSASDEEEAHTPGDIVIHQCIEVIEFTLGCISNTASYLRLWALSLAHSQLSLVFLEKAMFISIGSSGVVGVLGTFVAYAVFAAITFAVLMCMDNLECFLHALRLHWIEFQNKFFKGDGIAFSPLSFKRVLTDKNVNLD